MITTIPRSRTLLTAALIFGAVLVALIGASNARADTVTDWYDQTNNAVTASLASGVSAQASNSRIWAYAWTAADDAVDGRRERSRRDDLRGNAGQAATAQSVHDVLVALTPQIQPALDAQLTTSLAAIPNGWRKSRGITAGADAAADLLAERAGDGLDFASLNLPFTPGPAVTGEWQFVP
ncbi:MAG: phosphoesterase PA-phosphatase, partial [Solirubrobacterales bacterium]